MEAAVSMPMALPDRSGSAVRTAHRTAASLLIIAAMAQWAGAATLRVMKTGLGSGTVTSPAGINCGSGGTACDLSTTATVTLTAAPASEFVGWGGDCSGASPTCNVTVNVDRSVRAEFRPATAIPALADLTPEGIQAYLAANPTVTTAAAFLSALSDDFRQNWILMSRSEALQTGTAQFPRILLPNADATAVFSLGLATHSSYPGSHPNAIEYMQWDPAQKNFRFHEVVVAPIPEMGTDVDGSGTGLFPARSRGVAVDDSKCSKCHSTRNVLNPGSSPGTDGVPPRSLKVKNKPNWDTYDSWAGMLPFNRDRIYQGSVEAAAIRKLFNLWTWRSDDPSRAVIEQLQLQPPGIPANHAITRTNGGAADGHVNFAFDASPPVTVEPPPTGSEPSVTTNYAFDGAAGAGAQTVVVRQGTFLTLHHSAIPASDEGRGVHLFDLLGGQAGTNLNQLRVADEINSHRFATGSVPIDVRPAALAITSGCLTAANLAASLSAPATAFLNARNGMDFTALQNDTRLRQEVLPRRKADIQKLNFSRTGDIYLDATAGQNGLIQEYGAATSQGTGTSLDRLRQEVFRRSIGPGSPDLTVMLGLYVDREQYSPNTEKMALYRYLLEPFGVSVDKWSMGVRGRSRSYTFADIFSTYIGTLTSEIQASLAADPFPGLSVPAACPDLIAAVNASFAALPPAEAVPTYTDVQRILNKGCIECHGGLNYPPVSREGVGYLNFSENENPAAGGRLDPSHAAASDLVSTDPATSYLYQRITQATEDCPDGMMPCGGPPLSKADIETIRRWIVGAAPNTAGDPHIKTVDGTNYDFQSAGEFTLLRGENLEIQVRQSPVATGGPLGANPHTGLSSCVSLNTAVAIQAGGHRITYQPNLSGVPDTGGLQLRIDGILVDGRSDGGHHGRFKCRYEYGRPRGRNSIREIVLAEGGRILPTTAPGGIQIEAAGGTDIVVTPAFWTERQLWYLNIDVRHARATEGVMGAIAPGQWLPALPDGTLLGPRPASLGERYQDLYETFADDWRVTDTSSLFDYAPGTSTATFTLQAWPYLSPESCPIPVGNPDEPHISGPAIAQAGLPATTAAALTPAEAARLCAAVVDPDRRANCVLDVQLTGEAGFATTYRLTERIQRNHIPAAPKLVAPRNNQADLGRTVTFTWKKSLDRDRGRLEYRHCLWAQGEPFTFNQCVVVPKDWDPHADWCGDDRYDWDDGFAAQGGRSWDNTMSVKVTRLDRGKTYFWKVIVQDGQGGTAESESRRFKVRK